MNTMNSPSKRRYFEAEENLWHPEKSVHDVQSLILALSGNTAAGKSTLLQPLANLISRIHSPISSINERQLQHPVFGFLLTQPETFGFEVQLDFMLQRSLLKKRWIEANRSIVIERCLLDDLVFIDTLQTLGYVTTAQHDDFVRIWRSLIERGRVPDLIVYLSIDPELSLERLKKAEGSGERTREFSSPISKEELVNTWSKSYERYFVHEVPLEFQGRIVRVDVPYEFDELAQHVEKYLVASVVQ